jgi:hypothetical protein
VRTTPGQGTYVTIRLPQLSTPPTRLAGTQDHVASTPLQGLAE